MNVEQNLSEHMMSPQARRARVPLRRWRHPAGCIVTPREPHPHDFLAGPAAPDYPVIITGDIHSRVADIKVNYDDPAVTDGRHRVRGHLHHLGLSDRFIAPAAAALVDNPHTKDFDGLSAGVRRQPPRSTALDLGLLHCRHCRRIGFAGQVSPALGGGRRNTGGPFGLAFGLGSSRRPAHSPGSRDCYRRPWSRSLCQEHRRRAVGGFSVGCMVPVR